MARPLGVISSLLEANPESYEAMVTTPLERGESVRSTGLPMTELS